MHLALMGTRGVPARYGGFETAVYEIGRRLAARGEQVTVYSRNPGQRRHLTIEGMQVVNLPAIRRRELETLSHTGLSALRAAFVDRPDACILFNAGNAPFIPFLRAARIPTAVHLDGLEWQRAKWKGLGATYYRKAERMSVLWADAVIADAQGIADHVTWTYQRESEVIAYGAPVIAPGHERLAELGLTPGNYHLVVARIEPENHVDLILEGYLQASSSLPLVLVGSAPYASEHSFRISQLAARDRAIHTVGAVWDQVLLDQLYAHCATYLHGHSVGGTNPSLLRAMGAGAPVIAYDVTFNREVTGGHGLFFHDAAEVAKALSEVESDRRTTRERASLGKLNVEQRYNWDRVSEDYLALATRLAK